MNTFRLESPRPFKAFLVERAARELLESALLEAENSSSATTPAATSTSHGALSLLLATQLREKVMQLDFLRYKFVVMVQIMEKKSQGINVCCRFLWDTERDNFMNYRHETENLIALATVFAIYYD